MTLSWPLVVSFLSSAPLLLCATGLVFLILDFFAVYQLRKIYSPSVSGTPLRPRQDEARQAFLGCPPPESSPYTEHSLAAPRHGEDLPPSAFCTDFPQPPFSPDEHPFDSRGGGQPYPRAGPLEGDARDDRTDEDESESNRRPGIRAALEQWSARALPHGLFRFQRGDEGASPSLAVPPSLTGGQTRSAFMLLLSAAILARALSLFLMAWIVADEPLTLQNEEAVVPPSNADDSSVPTTNPEAGDPSRTGSFESSLDREWILLFLDSAPSLVFFSALSLIVLFWAKIYYAAILVAYPHFEKGPWLCSGGLLAFFLLFFTLAVLLQAKRSATRALQILAAILFALAAGAFFVYGTKVAKKLSERSKAPSRKKSIVRRHSMDSTVAAPLMHQNFYPLLSPPAYVQPPALYDLNVRHNAAGGSQRVGACVSGSAPDGVVFQSYAPYPGGGTYSPGYGMPPYNGPYYQQCYPPPAL
ncbi:conserved hypothetical protein [Neospora caninum Liverpool]|uniref:THH1/TOM1/TOM3 domain-containing protein n=1 Tax=Neospora caninum (strain Liverpool) TaxID=572307 RepID=F0V8Q4_NEOCL|nr:conserved hypothetical protein [Neospora caninum Liverpool]CBZ50095.1 conserved hypothetical protein [Neospora caninum Liverpool]|eukprot:XP_003880130.1 conserved hypothetical protein [Neospora caninum Liverpool]